MKSFDEFLAESAVYPGGFNLVFEVGMHSLGSDVEKIVLAFRDAGLGFEIVGGVAVNAHLFLRHRSRSFVTRDIDILLRRSDLEQAARAAEQLGYQRKKMMGGYALIRPGQELGEAIHLLFVAEKSKSTQPFPHPDLHPEEKDFLGISVPVAPLRDLLQMKLSSFRPKDLVHIEILDEAGLISAGLESDLPSILRERLREARERIAADKPDVEG